MNNIYISLFYIKKVKLGKILLILLSILSCQNVHDKTNNIEFKYATKDILEIKGSQWQYKVTNNCIDYYLFSTDSNYIYYSGEADYKSYGKYYIEKDTIYLYEYAYDIDSILSEEDGYYGLEKSKYKIVIELDKLKHIEKYSYSKIKNKWIKDTFVFDDDFLFEKVK